MPEEFTLEHIKANSPLEEEVYSWLLKAGQPFRSFSKTNYHMSAKYGYVDRPFTKDGKPTGRGCLLAAADIYRPAAIKQLQTLGKQIGVEVFSMGTEADPADIATKALERAKELAEETGKPFTLIVDTAGRQVIKQ